MVLVIAVIADSPFGQCFSRDIPAKGSTRPCFRLKRGVWGKKSGEKRFSGRFFRVFPEVMGKSDQAELDRDLLERSQSEALEAVVELNLAEDRLGLYRPLASVPQPLLAVEELPRLRPQLVVPVVDLDGPRPLALVALSPHRASIAALGLVYADHGHVAEVRHPRLVADMLHPLSHRADVEVELAVAEQVLHPEDVVAAAAFLLGVEHVVLDEGVDVVAEQVLVVLLAAVARVGDHGAALPAVLAPEGLQVVDQRALVCRPLVDAVVGDELVLGGYLDVVSGLGLAVHHVVLLHPHERGVGVGLAVAVAVAHLPEVPLVLGLLRKHLVPDLLHRPAPRALRDSGLVHPLEHLLGTRLEVVRIGLVFPVPAFLRLDGLLGLGQHNADLALQLGLAPLDPLPPNEGVLVGGGLYLRPVDVLDVEAHQPLLVEHRHHLREDALEGPLQPLAPEQVYRPEVRPVHPGQPHVGDVLRQQRLHPAPGVDVVEVGVRDHLEQHPRMVDAGPACLVPALYGADVQPVDHGVHHPGAVVGGYHFLQSKRKKRDFVLRVRFIY